MKKELNLQCPYKVFFDTDSKFYTFTTKNGIEYKILFADTCNLFEGTSTASYITKVHYLTIEKETKVTEPLDDNTRETIETIITQFFSDKENSLLYVCDCNDGKELKRKLKFSNWYEKSSLKTSVTKIDKTITTEDNIHYSSLIYHTENPFKSSLEQAYYEISDNLDNK